MKHNSFSWLKFLGLCFFWSLIGSLAGFMIFGVFWDPNGCRFLDRSVFNQVAILTTGFFIGPIFALDLYVPDSLGGIFVSGPLISLLLIALVLGVWKRNFFVARTLLYIALAMWFAFGAFRWALYC